MYSDGNLTHQIQMQEVKTVNCFQKLFLISFTFSDNIITSFMFSLSFLQMLQCSILPPWFLYWKLFIILLFIKCVCVCVCMNLYVLAWMWRSQDNLWDWYLSSTIWVPGINQCIVLMANDIKYYTKQSCFFIKLLL